MSSPDAQYMQQVFATLQSNPTAANLDFLVEAYARIGFLASKAESEAEMAEAQRKYDEAQERSNVRLAVVAEGLKATAADIDARVVLLTFDSKKAEIKAREKASKLKNLLESVEQAINAIKFLGRYDSPVNGNISLPGRRT